MIFSYALKGAIVAALIASMASGASASSGTSGRTVKVITSMATRVALQELARAWRKKTGTEVIVEAAGGVDVAKRLRAGEAFDAVFLGSDALDAVISSGDASAASKTDLFRSVVAVAVKSGTTKPDISTESALRETIRSARTLGYSTGPSGLALAALFERWGIASEIKSRIVVPAPGIPVGALVAQGEVELGFQQLSEFIHVKGIDILGGLPPPVEIVTIFSAAVCSRGSNLEGARAFLDFVAGPEANDAKLKQGLQPAVN